MVNESSEFEQLKLYCTNKTIHVLCNNSLCGFSCTRFRTKFHQYSSSSKFEVADVDEKLVCKSYTDSVTVKMEEQVKFGETNIENDFAI